MKLNQKGFSLIELLIVLIILSIVAVIAIPNLLAARRAANEGSAISTLRTLHGAQMLYQTSKGAGNYAGTINSIGDTTGLAVLNGARMIDDILGSGTKSGYNFVGAITLSNGLNSATFYFSANPVSDSGMTQSGTRRYCINQQGFLCSDTINLSVPFNSVTVLAATPFNTK